MTDQNQPQDFRTRMARLGEPLDISQIEFRVQSIAASGWAVLLAYKDARVDQDRLDNAVGRGFWQRKHQRMDGREYCHVGVYNDELKEWVWVSDVGVPSNTEAVKGEASDAFKRACFNLGIGRELYQYPLILVQLNPGEFDVKEDKGKKRGQATYNLKLKEWTWHCQIEKDEHGRYVVTSMKAIDQNRHVRFTYPTRLGSQQPQEPAGDTGSQHNQPQNNQSGQAPASSGNQNDLPWYNNFEKDKEWFQNVKKEGHKVEAVLAKLRQTYRVNKKTEADIKALFAGTSQ